MDSSCQLQLNLLCPGKEHFESVRARIHLELMDTDDSTIIGAFSLSWPLISGDDMKHLKIMRYHESPPSNPSWGKSMQSGKR